MMEFYCLNNLNVLVLCSSTDFSSYVGRLLKIAYDLVSNSASVKEKLGPEADAIKAMMCASDILKFLQSLCRIDYMVHEIFINRIGNVSLLLAILDKASIDLLLIDLVRLLRQVMVRKDWCFRVM